MTMIWGLYSTNAMKKTYEIPSMTVVLIERQYALLSSSSGDGDKTPGVHDVGMDSIEQPYNG